MTSITCLWFHPEGAPGQVSRMDMVAVKSTENLSYRKPHMKQQGKKISQPFPKSTHKKHFSGGLLMPGAFPAFIFISSKFYS